MFIIKNKYFFIIQSIKDIELKNIKNFTKFNIIYRNNTSEDFEKLKRFRLHCKTKRISFFVANDIKLMRLIKADGLYISAYNKDFNLNRFKNQKYKIIGSAHNQKEINIKSKQGCAEVLFSRIFKTSYIDKMDFLGIIKFNLIARSNKMPLVALGGINTQNLKKLKTVKCNSIALSSEIKNKNYINRNFY